MRPGAFRGLLSDCDGVIVDSEPVADRIMVEVLSRAFGRTGMERMVAPLVGNRVLHIIEQLADRLAVRLDAAECRALQEEIDSQVAERAPAMPDVVAVYSALSLPVGIVSNSARHRLELSVLRSGLAALVGDHVYSADDVARPKPAPDLYLHAAAGLGVAPAECLVIEDSVVGVQAARAAGMTVLGFLGGTHLDAGHGARLTEQGAVALYASHLELPALLDRLDTGNPAQR